MANSASRALAGELKDLMTKPLEGVNVQLVDDSNLFKWEVAIFGPPDTIYCGGYFKTQLDFPETYPFEPPKMKFLEPIFHPNVYPSGEICISILHPPGKADQRGELPEERWNPTQRVRTIVLSVISLLNEPNISSPADVDASVAFRKWKEGQDDTFEKKVKQAVAKSKVLADKDGVEIPTTVEEYCLNSKVSIDDDMDDTMDDDLDDDVEFMTDDDDDDFDDSDGGSDDDDNDNDDNTDDNNTVDSGNER